MRISYTTITVVLLLLVGALAAKKEKDVYPACDDARKKYEKDDLYATLGLKKTATDADIKKAFRKMSVKCMCEC
jgi:preprotein translocase subunit Sec63